MQAYHVTHYCPITSHQMHVLISHIKSYVSLCLVQARISNMLIIPAWGLTGSIITLSHGAKPTLICNCIGLGYEGREHCTCAFTHIIFLNLSLCIIRFLITYMAVKPLLEGSSWPSVRVLGFGLPRNTWVKHTNMIYTWQGSHGVYVVSNEGDVQ